MEIDIYDKCESYYYQKQLKSDYKIYILNNITSLLYTTGEIYAENNLKKP